MSERKFKILVIASSIPLLNHAREIAEERSAEILFSSKGLEEALPAAQRKVNDGVEVIVSRGGTAAILRENLHIPVLSIPMTSQGILSSIKEAATLGRNILLNTFRQKISGLEVFEELFNVKLTQGIYNDSDSMEKAMISAQNQGCQVVIGGGVSMKLAKKHGLQGVELQTAKETIASILEDAENVAKSNREEQERTERYRCIIDATSEAIIAVNVDGNITTINKAARDLLGANDSNYTGKHIKEYMPKTTIMKVVQDEQPIFNKIETINKDIFVGNHIPIKVKDNIVGGVTILKDVSNVIKAENEVRRSLAKGFVAKYRINDIIYKSSGMKEVIIQTKRFAASDLTILITGETGTGKELLSHSIHNLGKRKRGPFVSINCAALPTQLLESELFGHEEGAFTGARKGGKPGLFELAHKGTIFLDEIGTTPKNVQTRLLRVLQEKEVMRIGGDRVIPIDVRVVAASNSNLVEKLKNGTFRDDLFFRINVLNINVPPLRKRVEDIPLLVEELVKRAALRNNLKPIRVPNQFIERLMEHSWPGNIRQLENFVERIVLLSGLEFSPDIFYESYRQLIEYPLTAENETEEATTTLKEYLQFKNETNEAKLILRALKDSNFSKTKAAKQLGISRTTLWRKLKPLVSN